MLKKVLSLILGVALLVSLCGCDGKTEETEHFNIDRKYFYGVCYNPYYFYESVDKNHNYSKAIDAVGALGSNMIRNFMHAVDLLEDPYTLNEENVAWQKSVVKKANENGIEIIGQNHKWFNGYEGDSLATPMRNTDPDSAYSKFLLLYEQSWYTLVSAFPEITYWEIGNEWNSDIFLHPYAYNDTGLTFTLSEKAEIATDMLYYASRGIFRANPNAVTIMGGLVDFESSGWGNAKGFLRKIYDNIESGEYPSTDTDEYFQALGWHPYNHDAIWSDSWVKHNIDIYSVIKEREGRDKPIFFTEMGYSDYGDQEKEKDRAQLLKKTMKAIENEMPFVKCVCWFRLFNDEGAYGWAANDSGKMEANFGLFTEPDKNGFFTVKETGRAYKELTKSTADLEIFSK